MPALLRGQAVRSADKHGFFGQVTDADLWGVRGEGSRVWGQTPRPRWGPSRPVRGAAGPGESLPSAARPRAAPTELLG